MQILWANRETFRFLGNMDGCFRVQFEENQYLSLFIFFLFKGSFIYLEIIELYP